MTAVDWIHSKILLRIGLDDNDIIELRIIIAEAKEMEKQQILKSFDEGQEYEYQYHINSAPKFDSLTYYQETFKQD